MTQTRETIAEFVKRVNPKIGDAFKDSQGNFWQYFENQPDSKGVFKSKGFSVGPINGVNPFIHENSFPFIHHDFIEPKKPKLLAPAIYFSLMGGNAFLSAKLYQCSLDAECDLDDASEVIWPAIRNKDGFYEYEQS